MADWSEFEISIALDDSAFKGASYYAADIFGGVSTPTRAVVEIGLLEPVALDDFIDKDMVLSLQLRSGVAVSHKLRVWEMELSRREVDTYRYRVELMHPVHWLTTRDNIRSFQEQTSVDIIKELFKTSNSGAKLKSSFAVKGTGKKWEYCVQYRESDWAFLVRMLAYEGWYFDIDPKTGEVAVHDTSSSAKPVDAPGGAKIPFGYQTADDPYTIRTFRRRAIRVPSHVCAGDWNFETPGIDLTSKASLAEEPVGELYLYPGGFDTQADGGKKATQIAESVAASSSRFEASSNSPYLLPGQYFELVDAMPAAFCEKYFILSQSQHVRLQGYEGTKRAGLRFRTELVGLPLALLYRPPFPKPNARRLVHGAHLAEVVGPKGEEIHVDKYGRVRTRLFCENPETIPSKRKQDPAKASPWMRSTQMQLGGSMHLPRMGWEVALRYLHGLPERPFVVGRLNNGKHRPAHSGASDNPKSLFQTLTSKGGKKHNAFGFDDTKDAMLLHMDASKDYDATVENDVAETIAQNDTLTVGTDQTTRIEKNQKWLIKGNHSTAITKDYGQGIGKDRTESVAKNLTEDTKGGFTWQVDKDSSESVTGDRTVSVKGTYAEVVTKSATWKATKNINRAVKGSSDRYVAGDTKVTATAQLKWEAKDKSHAEEVGGKVNVTVGGAALVQAKKGVTRYAKKTSTISVGGMINLTSPGGSLQIKAKTVSLTASAGLTMIAGGSIVSLTPASTALIGMVTLKGSSGVKIAGKPNLAGLGNGKRLDTEGRKQILRPNGLRGGGPCLQAFRLLLHWRRGPKRP